MEDFCRGCLLYCEDKNELVQYTDKNRRLFIYATGIQVKANDFFKFQICKICLTNLQATCQFKKQCRTSDKIYNKFMTIRDTNMDFHDFIKTAELRSTHKTSLKKHIERNKEEIVSPSNSILNFMNAMDEDMAPTEKSIINEVIQEDVDILDDSIDSQWLQDDDQCLDLDFRFTPFLSPRVPISEKINHCYVPLLDTFSEAISTMKMDTSNRSCGIDRNIEKALIRNKNQCLVADLLRSPSDTQSLAPEENDKNMILQDIRLELESMNNINNKAKVPVKNLKVMKDLHRKTEGVFDVPVKDISCEDADVDYMSRKCDDESETSSLEEQSNINNSDDDIAAKCKQYQEKNVKLNKYEHSKESAEEEIIVNHNLIENDNNDDEHNSVNDMTSKSIQSQEGMKLTESEDEIILFHNITEDKSNNKELDLTKPIIMKSEIYFHVPKTPWNCKLCDVESFKRQLPLKRHYAKKHNIDLTIKIVQPKQQIICIFCGKISRDASNARRHLMSHKRNKERCNNKDKKKENIAQDVKENENEKITNRKSTDNVAEQPANLNLEFHIHHPKQPIICKHCNEKFTLLKALKNHYALEHKRNVIIKKRQAKKDFICPLCGKISSHLTNAKRHLETHKKEGETHKCFVCGLEYNSKNILMKHMRTHEEKTLEKIVDDRMTTEKQYKCTECPYTAKYNQNLKTHMRRHSKQYNVFCDICSKGFYTKYSLTRHMRVHIGDKPYCCTQCPAKFTRSDVLSYHMRSHTGERPYYCDLCESVYTTRSELQYHKKVLCFGHPLPDEIYSTNYES